MNSAAGSEPYGFTVGDFNGDAISDLAVTNVSSNKISVLIGNGDGTFDLLPSNFDVGPSPGDVVSADFNGDGKLDIAASNSGSNTVTLLLGNGNGTFGARTDFTAGSSPFRLITADVNGDGKADLVTANGGSNNVSVLLGTGNGSFGTATNFTSGNGPLAVQAADFDNDGKLDLAVANASDSNVSILRGLGNGTFDAPLTFDVGANAVSLSLTVGDFNGDGKQDVATSNLGNSNLSVLLNTTVPNSGPAAQDDIAGVAKGKVVVADAAHGVLANDTDPNNDTLHVTAINGTSANVGHALRGDFGTLTLNADGSYSYAADKGGSASAVMPQDTFTYTIDDGHGGTSTATLTVSVVSTSGTAQTYVKGTDGDDTLSPPAGASRTVLDGGNGNDVLVGGNGADALIGGRGNDTLTGGKDSDTFVFNPNFGKDLVTDFKPGDHIQIDNTLFANFAAVQAHAASDGQGNTVITYDANDTITLTGVAPSQLHASDFFFV